MTPHRLFLRARARVLELLPLIAMLGLLSCQTSKRNEAQPSSNENIAAASPEQRAAAPASKTSYGKPGEPVKLVIGYQPYYTQAWSAAVMREKKFYEKYLPKGSTVEFQIGLQGTIIVNNMLAGKQSVGYMGDMPSIVATTKQDTADLRIVATLGLGQDQCNIFLTRNDAPAFADAMAAVKWLDKKQVASPKGSCTDRFAQTTFKKQGVEPSAYLNQNIEVITSSFRADKIDAAVIWEPVASRLVVDGLAKRVASGINLNETDGGYLVFRADLLAQRPDIASAWLEAELDAQLFLGDEANAAEVARLVKAQTSGFSEKALWYALYGRYPDQGDRKERLTLPFTITPESKAHLESATAFLHTVKAINAPKLRPEAVVLELSQAVLEKRGLTAPIGSVETLPKERAPQG